ncbi:hypothetical protein P8452_76201 [Trifolium repens]|nr:hypothetical protein P8452_76201 [Trifolium repens]
MFVELLLLNFDLLYRQISTWDLKFVMFAILLIHKPSSLLFFFIASLLLFFITIMTTTPTPTPPNTQPTQSSGQSIASSVKLYKPTDLTDIGWRWNSLQDLKNKKKVTCDFCGEESTGGITRAKQHQMGVGGQVKGCLKTPDNVKKQLREADEKKKAAKAAMAGEVNENADDIADLQEISRIRSGKRPVESGSMPAAQKKTKASLLVVLGRSYILYLDCLRCLV